MSTGASGSPVNAWPRRRLLLAVVLVTAAVVVLVLALRAGSPSPSGAPPATTASVTTSGQAATTASPTATTSPTPPSSPPTVTRPDSALAQLQPFLSAARRTDDRLHAAARAINAAGPPWVAISAELAQKVRVADPDAVAVTVPAGMPSDLLLSTLTVFSDLASRRAAMESFTIERSPGEYDPKYKHYAPDELLAELANGVPAASRFDADLAALTELARSSRPFVPAPATSRAEGERLLLLSAILKDNFGCDARGGGVVTELPLIRWTSPTSGTLRMAHRDAGMQFTAVRAPDGRYVDAHPIGC